MNRKNAPLYHALAVGTMGIVSPITAVLSAAIPAVAGAVRGDRLTAVQLGGIALALVAIALVSLSRDESGRRAGAAAGLKEAIAAGAGLGLFLLLLGFGHARTLHPLFLSRVTSLLTLIAVAAVARVAFDRSKAAAPQAIVSGVMDMAANVSYVVAAQMGSLAIAAVLTSLYPAATVVLARAVLGERLRAIQIVGMALALAGAAMLAI